MANGTWGKAKSSWRAEQESLIERFRPLYRAELERFAEELRPRFEAGELRGETADDLERYGEEGWIAPMDQLEDLCAAHFGIEVDTVKERWVERDPATAGLVLAASPSAGGTYDPGQTVSSFRAKLAISWDVIAVARARGWYVPDPDEEPSLNATQWAQPAAQTAVC